MDQYIGKLLDNRYEILELIGTGGMARVYKALCHRLNRLVAIKILREDLAQDAEFRRRFHDESQAVAMLSHPNIVAVYDVSRSSDLEYIVMELIDGITLKQYMQRKGNKLNWREALHFITQVTKALGHAHSRGIIHRDIKPHNIMVLRDGSVKVADFGIAQVTSSGHSTLTQEALGSVHYISPEQARGSHIDARSDLYSTGVVLYEMITGRLPFEGDTPVSVAIQHINSIPLSPRELDPSIPEALEAITMRAMAPNPDNRYASADDMLADLEEFRKNPNINFDYRPIGPYIIEEPPDSDDTRRVHRRPRHEDRDPNRGNSGYGDRYEDPPSGTSLWVILVSVAAILLFVAGIAYFLIQTLFSDIFTPAARYPVPSLVGQNYESVLNDASLLGRFKLVLGETRTDESKEIGTILSQNPAENSEVGEDVTEITVVVSGGPDLIPMIDVTNQEYRDAYLALTNLGLSVPTPEYKNDEEVPVNHVISYTPLEGAMLTKGTPVHLVVSTGPKEIPSIVPPLIGLTLEKAQSDIRTVMLEPGEVEEVFDDTAPVGTVVNQFPAATEQVPKGTIVNLQVSKGPDPSTIVVPPPPEDVTKTVSVNLPSSGEIVNVKAMVDGQVIFDRDYDTAMELTASVSVTAPAGSTKTVTFYFDGVQGESQTVEF